MLPVLTVHVAVTHFSLKGRCMLAVHLTPDAAPGVSSVDFSFAQPPQLDMDFEPFGLPVGDLPFVLDVLNVRSSPL